jgi:hypothetical protein
MKRREPSRRHEDRIRAPDLDNFSQQLAALHLRIILGRAIASGSQMHPVAGERLAYDPVNEKTAVAHVKHNLARLGLFRADGLDGENVSRPQSWEHAESGRTHL